MTTTGTTGRPDPSVTDHPAAPPRPERARSGLRALWPYVRGHRGPLFLAASLALVGAALALAQPVLVNRLIQAVQAAPARVHPIVVTLLVVIVLTAVVTGYQQLLLGTIGEDVVRGARRQVSARLLRMPVARVLEREPGELVSRVTADTLLVRSAVSGAVVGLLGSGVTVVGSVVALVLIDPVTFAVAAGVAVLAVLVSIAAARPVRRINVQVQETTGALAARLQRAVVGVRLIRAYGAQDHTLQDLDILIGDAHRHGVRLARVSALVGPVSATLVSLALVVAIIVGGIRAAAGGLDLAGLVTFLMFFNMLVGPLNQLSSAVLQLQHAVAGHERLVQITAIPDEDHGDRADPRTNGGLGAGLRGPEVTFEEVTFRYDASQPSLALDRVSFTAPGGRLTALVGPSGAGKTTTFHLIERFVDPEHGSIRLDGADVTGLDRAALRAATGYVDQGATALSGSLRDNLTLGAPHATDAQLHDAVRTAQLAELVGRLPEGLDSELGQAGGTVSGGERQRLSIARALLRSPRLLLLDEPTASLDGRTEGAVLDVLDGLRPGTTTVVVAHRLATVRHADKIVVLERGRVVDEGKHSELTGRCALYRELVRTQLA